MKFRTLIAAALCPLPLLLASPVQAQDSASDQAISAEDLQKDTLTIGIGPAIVPSYEGSDDYNIIPAGGVRGQVSGFKFWTRGTQAFFDVIPNSSDLDISVGPMAGVRLSRTRSIKDEQVKALGKLDTAIEVGGFVGIAKTGVITSDYDTLGVSISYSKDINGAHGSHIITPAIEYGTPLSTKSYVGLSLSADFVGDGFASYYYDVTPAGAAASGLSAFDADGGFKSWSLGFLGNTSLTGNLLHGLSLFAIANYSRLQKDFKRSPIVSEAGSPNQWMGAIGLAYTF